MIVLPFPPASLPAHAKGPWSEAETAWLREVYGQRSVKEIAAALGRTPASVRNRAYWLEITVRDDGWSDAELQALREAYASATYRGDLKDLIVRLGRTKCAVSTKAAQLGLTDRKRPRADPARPPRVRPPPKFATDAARSAAQSARMIAQHRSRPHPMKGKTHTVEARKKIGASAVATWNSKTGAARAAWTDARLKAKLEKYGTLANPRPHASWKAGWREVGDKRNYYRSRWESNYARYLQWLKERGEIADWFHEPETFWFEGIKRGVRSYLPDFRVFENDGSSKLHEVKGWMDARSKTTLRRMAKYHPAETIVLIRERDYNSIARQIGPLIEGWESSNRSDRP